MELKGSKTEANLMTAFSGECMARVKYELYAAKARAEGYEQYGNVADEISLNEREHAEIWFKALTEADAAGTAEAFADAEEGELYEGEEMYPRFAATAREEGFEDIARLFEEIAGIERRHARIYREMRDRIESATVFERERPAVWVCLKCGNAAEGVRPPEICPVCGHSKAFRKTEECD